MALPLGAASAVGVLVISSDVPQVPMHFQYCEISMKIPLMWNFPRDLIILLITFFIYISDFTFSEFHTCRAFPMAAVST